MSKNGEKEIKAGIGYTVGNFLIKGIVFITLPIFSRLLSTDQFGIYNTYMAYEAILAIIIGLGLYSSIKNAKFDFSERIDTYVSTILWITVIPLLILLLIGFAFRDKISELIRLPIPFIFLLILESYGTASLSISNAKFSLNYSYKKYMGYAAFNTILNVVISVILILTIFDNNREYGRIIGSAIPLVLIGIYVFVSNQRKSNFGFDKSMAKYAVMFGFPLIWHYLSQQIQNQFDRIAITNIIGPSETGIYSFAYSIAIVLEVVFYSIDNVWGVWMYGQMELKNYKNIRQVSKKYMLLIATITILMMVFSKEVIMVMGDYEYREGATIFIPIIIGMFMLYLYTIPVGIEYYLKETKYIAIMTFVAAAVNVSTNYLFIPKFGYIAAAYTTLLSYCVQFASHWIISKKLLKKWEITNVYYLKDIFKVLSLVCITGIAVLLLNPYPVIKYISFGGILTIIFCVKQKDIKRLFVYICG